ncbi:reverse transcriptase domain-containing protein [Tanacetum coccineum]
MESNSNIFECILRSNDTEKGVIMYDDMTYSLQVDIIDDEDVKLFVDCASKATGGIPHLYMGQTKKRNKDNTRSNGFSLSGVAAEACRRYGSGPWLRAVVYLHSEGVIASGCLGVMKKYCKNGKLERVVGVIMSCTSNALGDLTVTLKDPSGTMGGTIHYKVFNEENGCARSIKVGAILILRNVSVFTQKPSKHYLNITSRNIVMIFDKDIVF